MIFVDLKNQLVVEGAILSMSMKAQPYRQVREGSSIEVLLRDSKRSVISFGFILKLSIPLMFIAGRLEGGCSS